jgi:hypothetical protein
MTSELERQLAELEALSSIYPDECEVDQSSQQRIELFVANSKDGLIPTGLPMLQCTVKLDALLFKLTAASEQWCHPVISVAFPHEYPTNASPVATFFGDDAAVDDFAANVAHNGIIKACVDENSGEEHVMQLIMALNEHISAENDRVREDQQVTVAKQQAEKNIFEADQQKSAESIAPMLGRRLVYSHHIINPNKRKQIKEWASELGLGGYTKIGWPGIIVIEGPEDGCQEYVSRLQHLRWQYLSVRGEQQEEGAAGSSIDAMRALPLSMEMLGEDKMSELAQRCRDAGLEELFLTALKIYGRGGEGAQEQGGGDGTTQRTKKAR